MTVPNRMARMARTALAPLAGLRVIVPCAALALGSTACTSQRMSQVATDAVNILRTFENGGAIPPETIRNAKAIAVFRETEGAVVIGASGGEGVLVRRLAPAPAPTAVVDRTSPAGRSEWSPPLGIEVSTGSIGLQIGGQTREIVLVFNSASAIDQFLATGVWAIGRIEGAFGDAQGRTAPDTPTPDIVPFVRSGGLFGGVSINGLNIKASDRLNTAAYGSDWTARTVLEGRFPPPPGSATLWMMLDEMARERGNS